MVWNYVEEVLCNLWRLSGVYVIFDQFDNYIMDIFYCSKGMLMCQFMSNQLRVAGALLRNYQDIAWWSHAGLDKWMIELVSDVASDTVSQDGC